MSEYSYRNVFSDYGDDYKILNFPDGSQAKIEMTSDQVKKLVEDANRGNQNERISSVH